MSIELRGCVRPFAVMRWCYGGGVGWRRVGCSEWWLMLVIWGSLRYAVSVHALSGFFLGDYDGRECVFVRLRRSEVQM